MRVLRSTIYSPDKGFALPPMTTVVSEDSIVTTLEDMRQQLFDRGVKDGGFTIFEIKEVPVTEIEAATLLCIEAIDARAEMDMAILYGYTVNTILPMLHADGLFLTPDPSPLTADQIKAALEQVALHENYRQQTVTTRTPEGTVVTLAKGEVKIG